MKVTGAAQTVKRLVDELDRQLSGEYERRAEGIARAVEAQTPVASGMSNLTRIAMATRTTTSTYAVFGPGVLIVMAVVGIVMALAMPPRA